MPNERISPTKAERRHYFANGQKGAEFILDTLNRTRERGKRPAKGTETFSERESKARVKAVLGFLGRIHPAVPYVSLQLIHADVQPTELEEGASLVLQDFPAGINPEVAGDAVSVLATGLDRPVVAQFMGRTIRAEPDTHPAEVRYGFVWAASSGDGR